MSNKHQERIHREGAPRATSRPAVTVDPTTSIVTVTDKGPQIVRVSRAMFENLPGDGQSFVGHNYRLSCAPVVAGITVIGSLTVPTGMVLDISEISFHLVNGFGVATFVQGDFNARNALYFRTRVGGINPWDQFTIAANIATPTQEGWDVMNQNVMSSWSDTPVHLVVVENQLIEFLVNIPYAAGVAYVQAVNATNLAAYEAHMRGRWIPIQLYRDIVWGNRGGGESG